MRKKHHSRKKYSKFPSKTKNNNKSALTPLCKTADELVKLPINVNDLFGTSTENIIEVYYDMINSAVGDILSKVNKPNITLYNLYNDIPHNSPHNLYEILPIEQIIDEIKTHNYFRDETANMTSSELDDFISNLLYNHNIPDEIVAKYPNIYMNKLLFSTFIPLNIVRSMRQNLRQVLKINYDPQNITSLSSNNSNPSLLFPAIEIILYIPDNYNENTQYYNELIDKIYTRIQLIYRFACANFALNNKLPDKTRKIPTKTPHFFLYITPDTKQIPNTPDKSFVFTPECVNSAVTDGEIVVIYRKEELLKSIYHELIHFYKLDFPFSQTPPELIEYITSTHNLDSHNEYRLSEAITEVMANFLNICTNSYNNHQYFKTLFNNELAYSILNISKILRLLGYNSIHSFIKNTYNTNNTNTNSTNTNTNSTNTNNTGVKLKQRETSVLSYHIIKLYLLWNFHIYLKKCIYNRSIKFNHNFKELQNIISMAINSNLLLSIINKTLHKIKKTQKHNKTLKTFRMTCSN